MIQEEVRLKNAHRNYAKYNSNSPPIHQGNNVYTQQKTKISYHPISNKELGYTNDQKVAKKSPNHGLDTAIGLYIRPIINKQEGQFLVKKKYKKSDNDINSQQAIASSKNVPSFIQAKNIIKNSLCMGNQNLDSPRFLKTEQGLQQDKNNIQPFLNKKQGKIAQNIDVRSNSTQYLLRNKYPTFLLQKVEKKQKKAPFQNQVERPQSSIQVLLKSNSTGSLINSYGSMKKSKMEPQKINQEIEQRKQESQLVTWRKRIEKDKKLTMNDFDVIKQLGSGKYGKVFLVRQKKSNFLCALKIVQKKLLKEQQITQQFIRQLKIQSFLNHPNIIKMYGFFDDAINIYIILEVGTGGQLFKLLKRHQSMPQFKVAGIMKQVCQAVLQLHSHQIIHRDIKPENIVLNQGVIKLCDFGWSVYSGQTLRTTFCGSPLYVGPQILKGIQYDQKIDIWSLGIMMYQMTVGENPFKITKESQLIKIVKDQIKIASYIQISDQGRSFLFDCLQKNPDERKSIRELLNHEFFKKYPEKSEKKVNF